MQAAVRACSNIMSICPWGIFLSTTVCLYDEENRVMTVWSECPIVVLALSQCTYYCKRQGIFGFSLRKLNAVTLCYIRSITCSKRNVRVYFCVWTAEINAMTHEPNSFQFTRENLFIIDILVYVILCMYVFVDVVI
jgi:hypothetical protein